MTIWSMQRYRTYDVRALLTASYGIVLCVWVQYCAVCYTRRAVSHIQYSYCSESESHLGSKSKLIIGEGRERGCPSETITNLHY